MKNLEVPKETGWDKAHAFTKGVFGVIPMVGGVASETFGMVLSQPITKRREQWMQTVALVLLGLEKSVEKFKIENLKNNEEFVSFLIEASLVSFRNHQEAKLNALKNSVKNYFVYEHLEYVLKPIKVFLIIYWSWLDKPYFGSSFCFFHSLCSSVLPAVTRQMFFPLPTFWAVF